MNNISQNNSKKLIWPIIRSNKTVDTVRRITFLIVITTLLVGYSLSSLLLLTGYYPSATTIFAHQQSTSSIWEIVDHPFDQKTIVFTDIYFINATTGWVIGYNETWGSSQGIVLFTTDGGQSWLRQLNNISLNLVSSIKVVNDSTIWISSSSVLYISHDYGQTWNKSVVITGGYGIGRPEFINITHGFVGTGSGLFRTTNGGRSWMKMDSWDRNVTGDMPRQIHFCDKHNGWILGIYGIYHTADGGDTWQKVFDYGGWSFDFIDDKEAWMVGDNMLAHMTDGKNWYRVLPMPKYKSDPILLPDIPYFTDVDFIDHYHGWIVGMNPASIYTPNSGRDWYWLAMPDDFVSDDYPRLNAVLFINQTFGWAVGGNGYILRTTSGDDTTGEKFHISTGLFDFESSFCLLVLLGGGLIITGLTVYLIIVWHKKQQHTS